MITNRRVQHLPDSARALGKQQQSAISTQPSAGSANVTGAIMSQMIGICPECHGQLEHASGCDFCRDCGYSKCK
jgi:ribonucleoside-diphosphate reductase alpha chain